MINAHGYQIHSIYTKCNATSIVAYGQEGRQ